MKSILTFNDISGLGNCSMSANLPVFAKFGHYAMPVPTAVYSCQTGFGDFSFISNLSACRFAKNIISHRNPDAVYVGFGQNIETIDGISSLLGEIKKDVCCTLVDPIMGDNGKLYPVFDDKYVQSMRSLVRYADIITPNLTEACLLSELNYDEISSYIGSVDFAEVCLQFLGNVCRTLGVSNVIVTGVDCGEKIGNVLFSKELKPQIIYNKKVAGIYSGTGDLFSSVLLGKLLCCNDLSLSVKTAAEFVCEALLDTQCSDRRFGTEFCRVLDKLK